MKSKLTITLVLALSGPGLAQNAQPLPQPTALEQVRLDFAADAPTVTILLRNGRIAAVLEGQPTPPGYRVIDGEGAVALPAFIDAGSNRGCEMGEYQVSPDRPLNQSQGVLTDMRRANRKGLRPSFRAADALALPEDGAGWRSSGFGSALISPHGELLSGTSCLVVPRDVAPRDAVVREGPFQHAAFQATGAGYPNTLMGYHAQLRQFFEDSRHQGLLLERRAAGRPGPRPPLDRDLDAGLELLTGGRLMCDAETSRDIMRWIRLADSYGITIAIRGGNEAWRVASTLAEREIPVVLTLDWGEEPEDPLAAEEDEAEESEAEEDAGDAPAGDAPEAETLAADKSEVGTSEGDAPAADAPADDAPAADAPEADTPEADAAKGQESATEIPVDSLEQAGDSVGEPDEEPGDEQAAEQDDEGETEDVDPWIYLEPQPLALERRRLWLQKRDCAMRLAEAGVPFAFGTGGEQPNTLLENVRTLVNEGLDRELCLAALTTGAAEIVGAPAGSGTLAVGAPAHIGLWERDPLGEKQGVLRWIILDGFPLEQEDGEAEDNEPPDEGLEVTGSWELEFSGGDARPATAEITMDDDGLLTADCMFTSPEGQPFPMELEGRVSGSSLRLKGQAEPMEGFVIEVSLRGEFESGGLKGKARWKGPGFDESTAFSAVRKPENQGSPR
ncbi:MAG: hypothetical protein QF599_00920 [Planctomycetota bacterium]|nr:hypothetical protein [Planctomycetota bacterium]